MTLHDSIYGQNDLHRNIMGTILLAIQNHNKRLSQQYLNKIDITILVFRQLKSPNGDNLACNTEQNCNQLSANPKQNDLRD